MVSRGMLWTGEPQPDLPPAQQVGLHRRVRVSHSSMASGWRVQGSWREEDRPSHLREGPPLTSWAQARWGGGVLPACGVLWSRPGAGSLVPGHPPLGPLYPPPGPCGPPSWRKEQRGHQGGRKELRVGVLPGGIPSAIQGEAPGCAVFIVLAPQPTQTQGDNDRYFTLTPGPLLWVPALDLDFRGGGGVLRALPS